jgi:branched-chain amino acid transport system ATP-binding protein
MTVIENVQMTLVSHHRRLRAMLAFMGDLYRDEASDLLALVGMADQANRISSTLAYGDLKRLELAMALANEPKILLMDEPTAGMAPKERIQLMQLTADIVRERSLSVLFTEHDMDVVFNHADRILVLNRGELVAEGTAAEVRGNPEVQAVYLGTGSIYTGARA